MCIFFFFNDTSTTEIYTYRHTLSLHDALPILVVAREARGVPRGVRLAFARPRRNVAVVLGEEQRIVRVLDNLIDNAISFSPDGGLVQIVATVADNEVLVSVEDEGPGVPQSEREHVFRRLHSESGRAHVCNPVPNAHLV